MVVMVVVGVAVVAKNFADKALANYEEVTEVKVEETVDWLRKNDSPASQLAIAALEKTVSTGSGMFEVKPTCTDVVVSGYSALGVDLKELLYADMKENFRIYPQLWNLRGPDVNVDHRRVANLQRFFKRKGAEVEVKDALTTEGFKYGDVVAWRLAGGETHIGIVVPGPGQRRAELWIVHDLGNGPKWENSLLEYQIIGQYRYHESHGNVEG